MKKFLKKLSCALLAAAMVCAMTPLAASAAINYSKTRIVYMPTSGTDLGYDEISISNIPAKQSILRSNSASPFATPKTAVFRTATSVFSADVSILKPAPLC